MFAKEINCRLSGRANVKSVTAADALSPYGVRLDKYKACLPPLTTILERFQDAHVDLRVIEPVGGDRVSRELVSNGYAGCMSSSVTST